MPMIRWSCVSPARTPTVLPLGCRLLHQRGPTRLVDLLQPRLLFLAQHRLLLSRVLDDLGAGDGRRAKGDRAPLKQ